MRRILRFAALVLAAVAVGATLGPATAGPARGNDRWALIVGVDNHQGRTRSNVGAVGDAHDVREVLVRTGWPADHVMVLTDGAATAENIRRGFQWLAQNSSDTSFSVFHYSGHVKQMSGDRDRDGEALDEYLWPHDNRFIADAELGAAMRAVKGWLWVDISGCEAAGLNDGIGEYNRVFSGASQEHEKGYEHPGWRNSVWTHLVFERAMLGGQADYDGNGIVSVHEALHYGITHAPSYTQGQRHGPQHPYAVGGDRTEWFLQAPPPASPTPAPNQPPPERTCTFGMCVPVKAR